VAKFRGDRPRDGGDLALNKKTERKEKKETAAKQGLARGVIATGGPNEYDATSYVT